MVDQKRFQVRVKTPLEGFPVAILWPKELNANPRVLGRAYQMDELPGAYMRLEWRSNATDEVVTITDGGILGEASAIEMAPDPSCYAFSVQHGGESLDGFDRFESIHDGPYYLCWRVVGQHQVRFFEWWPDLGSGRMRIVLRNGTLHQSPDYPIADRVGDLTIRYGDTVLHHESDVRHHFGFQTSFRFAVAVDEDGNVHISKQTAPWPMAHCEIPLDAYADIGLIPRYDETVSETIASLSVRPTTAYPTDLNDSIEWTKGGASGGGKPQLAPIPAHDVMALHDPERFLADACYAADRFPYPFFFVDPNGAWIRPQAAPRVWADMHRPHGTSFRVPETPGFVVGDLVPSPYSTDAAHLPNAFVAPAILTGDPYYRWASKGLAFGVSMASRGESGRGWKRYGRLDGEITSPPQESVVHGRGPTGAEGWIGGQERAWGWGLWQRLHAIDMTGDRHLVDLARSCLAIARGHYLDHEITDDVRVDISRHWGAHCRPWWHDEIWRRLGERPESPRLSDGSGFDAYCRPQHAMNLDFVANAHASWQDAFMGMAIGKAHTMVGGLSGTEWLGDLLRYAVGQRCYMLENDLPVTEYVWPIRGRNGWLESKIEIKDGYVWDNQVAPTGGRTVRLDADGLCTLSGYAYVGYNAPGFNAAKAVYPESYDAWESKFDKIVGRLPIEWRVRG